MILNMKKNSTRKIASTQLTACYMYYKNYDDLSIIKQ